MQWPHVAYLLLQLIMCLCAIGKVCVVNTPCLRILERIIFLLTLIANILRDRIFLDGGRLWYQTYEVPHDQYVSSLTNAEAMMIAPSTNLLIVWATNRC